MKIKEIIKRSIRFVFKGVPVNKIEVNVINLNPSDLLKGKTALITGGSSGIGYSIAKAFVKAGANVIITGRNHEKVLNAAIEIKKYCHHDATSVGMVMDCSNINALDQSFADAISLSPSGRIDILVNNAGTMGKFGGFIKNCSEEEYDSILTTNLKAVFFLSKIVASYMVKESIKGNILNITSSSSLRPCISAYMLSKWGVRGLTEGLARMFAPHGIVVNGIAPGPTATPMLNKNAVDKSFSLPSNLSGRFAHPDEIGNMAVVLASDMGRMVVGDVVYMTGGSGNIMNDDISYNF